MVNGPLVSMTIPTYNAEDTLSKTLRSIQNQSYKRVETVIVDSFSKDNTVKIAKQFDAKIVMYEGKLLGARYVGLKKSKGEYILLLDSGQILDKRVIELALSLMERYDMLILEECAYEPGNWLQKLFEADKKLVNTLPEWHLNSLQGVILARFYRR